MSLPSGVFSISAATVLGLGRSILPAPPKKLRRSWGMSTMASSFGSMLFPVLLPYVRSPSHIIMAWPAGEGSPRAPRRNTNWAAFAVHDVVAVARQRSEIGARAEAWG